MRPWKCIAGIAGASLLLAAGFRVSPAFAALWYARVARPFAALAASLSEMLSFPLLEPLGFALILCAAAGFCRGWKKGLARLTAILSILLTIYVLAWLPGYFVPVERIWTMAIAEETQNMVSVPAGLFPRAFYSAGNVFTPGAAAQSAYDTQNIRAEQPPDEATFSTSNGATPSSARFGESSSEPAISPTSAELETLCLRLIDELNASKLRFTGGKSALLQAVEAMNAAFDAELGENAVRFARYPEWMAALDLAGFYSPWTGEALISPNLSAAALPFTACHELAHRLGVADEGAANIAAWIACRQSGGEPADSAALWALRYAMAELRASDESAWRRCTQEMRPALARTFASMNGFSEASNTSRSRFTLRGTGSYAALIPWLIEHSEAWK